MPPVFVQMDSGLLDRSFFDYPANFTLVSFDGDKKYCNFCGSMPDQRCYGAPPGMMHAARAEAARLAADMRDIPF